MILTNDLLEYADCGCKVLLSKSQEEDFDIVKQSSEVVLVDQVKVNSGTVARDQTQKLSMDPAPDTDVEEEDVENKMEEGGEVIMDIEDF